MVIELVSQNSSTPTPLLSTKLNKVVTPSCPYDIVLVVGSNAGVRARLIDCCIKREGTDTLTGRMMVVGS